MTMNQSRSGHVFAPRARGARADPHPAGRFRPYVIAWFGLAALGVGNGAARVALYDDRLSDDAAHQVSTVTATALFGAYTYVIDRRWPIVKARDALVIGAGWATATIAFELGFGHYVAGDSWSTLFHDWNVAAGRTWPLALASIAAAPWVVRFFHERRRMSQMRRGSR